MSYQRISHQGEGDVDLLVGQVGQADVVGAHVPQARQNLGEGSHDQVLAVSATTQCQE